MVYPADRLQLKKFPSFVYQVRTFCECAFSEGNFLDRTLAGRTFLWGGLVCTFLSRTFLAPDIPKLHLPKSHSFVVPRLLEHAPHVVVPSFLRRSNPKLCS